MDARNEIEECCCHISFLALVSSNDIYVYLNVNSNMGSHSKLSECDIFFGFVIESSFCIIFLPFFLYFAKKIFDFIPFYCFHYVDAPTIRLLGAPQIDLEEGKDSLVLRCEADANPPASIVWKRAGRSEIASLQVCLLNSYFFFLFLSVIISFYVH